MADHYLEFSEIIDNLTPEEAAWLEQQLGTVPNTDCPVFLVDCSDREPNDTDCGFEHIFEEDDGRCRLWVGSDYGSNIDHVAYLAQKFLKRFRPDQCWSLTYAVTCSKLRAGEFGGGAVFVTADEIKYQDTHTFVEQQRTEFQLQHPLETQT